MTIESARATKHPRSIAVVNYKGGVGKTTVTYLLGFYIALETARRVLLIDIDAQCSLSLAVGLDPEQSTNSQNVYHLVKPDAWPEIGHIKLASYVKPVPGLPSPLYIVPGGFDVENLDIEIVEAILSQKERSKDELFLYCRQLLIALDSYDYILIDCPPNKMYLTQAMLRACKFFIPVTIPDRISIYGMPRLLRWVTQIEGSERPLMLGYVLNSINRQGGSPAGKVVSQQISEAELEANLLARISRYEQVMMQNELCLGGIPRLDAIARFLGAQKNVHLDFAKRTSGQPTIDQCLKGIVSKLQERMQRYNA